MLINKLSTKTYMSKMSHNQMNNFNLSDIRNTNFRFLKIKSPFDCSHIKSLSIIYKAVLKKTHLSSNDCYMTLSNTFYTIFFSSSKIAISLWPYSIKDASIHVLLNCLASTCIPLKETYVHTVCDRLIAEKGTLNYYVQLDFTTMTLQVKLLPLNIYPGHLVTYNTTFYNYNMHVMNLWNSTAF